MSCQGGVVLLLKIKGGVVQLLKNIALVEGQMGRETAAKQTILRLQASTTRFHEFVKVHNLGDPKEVVTPLFPCELLPTRILSHISACSAVLLGTKWRNTYLDV